MPDWSGRGSEGSVNVPSPGAYAVSDDRGDICSPEEGLFYRDTRHLSRLVLTVGGSRLVSRGASVRGSRVEFDLVADSGAAKLSVLRRRSLGSGMFDEILFKNESRAAVDAAVSIECGVDFADVFTVRGFARALERGETSGDVREGALHYTYRRDWFSRGTVVRVIAEGVKPEMGGDVISLRLRIGAGEERLVRLSVELEEGGEKVRQVERAPLYAAVPELETGWAALRESWQRSIEDLESLAFDAGDGLLVPAAGTPWFMALFGRDSLITAFQALILSPEPARNVLRALARHQASGRDDFTDAEPGKILHELRRGEMAFFGEIPETPYYGTVDATPLFLVLLEELWRWTDDAELVREMEGAARGALSWILDHSDRVNGYVAYKSRSTAGLENLSWKDSANSMLFQNGARAEGPIAACEVQGYVYDALVRTAALAANVWDDAALAERLHSEARELKARFDRDFWMEDRGYYALALDGEGRRVDSVASNAGHLLWSGVVPLEKARFLAERLMDEGLFGGWGVRTMAVGEGGYDPASYHNGSVWPHDNALIAEGLRRYGFRREANRIATALVEAAPHFDYRLPEVFAGYTRDKTGGPVEYPSSCSPQAWAAGTVPLLVRTLLGLDPEPENRRLASYPVTEEKVSGLRLRGIKAFGVEHEVEV